MCYAQRAVLLAKEGHPSAAIRCDSVSRHRTRLPATFTGAACPGVRRPPAAWHEWSRRNGPAIGRHGASPSGSASSEHYIPAARRPRPATPRRILALAKESPGVVDELDVAPQRETLHHAFSGRIQTTAVFDRTEPKRIFQTGRGTRAGNTAVFRGFQPSGRILSLDVIQSLLDRRVIPAVRVPLLG